MEWIKLKSLIIVIPMLIVLPFWLTMVAYANLPFQPAGGAPQTFTGTSARSNMMVMVQGKNGQGQMVAPPLQIWLIEDNPGGRLYASSETPCTASSHLWSLSAGRDPAENDHFWVHCHWGGCGNGVKLDFSSSHGTLATPSCSLPNIVSTVSATSASVRTDPLPSNSMQTKGEVDAVAACTTPGGSVTMNFVLNGRVENPIHVPCNGAKTTLAASGLHTDQKVIFPYANATGTWTVKDGALADAPSISPPQTSSTNPSPILSGQSNEHQGTEMLCSISLLPGWPGSNERIIR